MSYEEPELNTIGDLARSISIRRNERYTGINVAVARVHSRFANIWKDSLRNDKPGGWLFDSPWRRVVVGVRTWKGNLFENHSNFLRSPSDPLFLSLFLDARSSETDDRKIWNIEMSIMERGPPKLGGKRRAQHMPRTRSTASLLPSNWNHSHELVVSLILSAINFFLSFAKFLLRGEEISGMRMG